MIQIVEEIDGDDYQRVSLPFQSGKVHIEFASNRAIDAAVLSLDEFKQFESTKDAEDEQEWYEAVRQKDFEFEIPDPQKKYFLVLWNCNSKRKALVAFKFSKSGQEV